MAAARSALLMVALALIALLHGAQGCVYEYGTIAEAAVSQWRPPRRMGDRFGLFVLTGVLLRRPLLEVPTTMLSTGSAGEGGGGQGHAAGWAVQAAMRPRA